MLDLLLSLRLVQHIEIVEYVYVCSYVSKFLSNSTLNYSVGCTNCISPLDLETGWSAASYYPLVSTDHDIIVEIHVMEYDHDTIVITGSFIDMYVWHI